MSSCVYYKFKSKRDSAKIVFDGSSISIKDLRERIILHSGLKANDMVLKIERPKDASNGKEGTEYKDDDIVKKFTTVIVSRMPCSKRDQTRSKIANPEIMSKKDPYIQMSKDSGELKFHEMAKATKLYELDVSEDDKINIMMKQSTDNFIIDRNPRNRGPPPGPPPVTYVCHKCNMTGHYVNQCPGIKDKDGNPVDLKSLKRPTGIPQDFLVEVEKDTPGAYLTKDGRYMLTIKDRDAYIRGKKEKRPFSEEENPTYVPTERKPPDVIVCQLCQQVMRQAVFISCCGYSYCQECVTDYVFNTDVKGCGQCPNCNSVVESAESFVPNPSIREMVRQYNSGTGDVLSESTSTSFRLKADSGPGPSSSSSVLNRPGPSSTAINAVATASQSSTVTKPTESNSNSSIKTSVPSNTSASQPSTSPGKGSEDDEEKPAPKEKETSAIRGPFVDGRRVLKPKPPPEVVLSRRSDTLKTEMNPALKPNESIAKSEDSTANQPEVEIDLGLDVTDTFLTEKTLDVKEKGNSDEDEMKEVGVVKDTSSDVKSVKSEENINKAEVGKDDSIRSLTPPNAEPSSGEIISVHTFDRSYMRRDWQGIARNSSCKGPVVAPATVALSQPVLGQGHPGNVPPLVPSVTAVAPSAVTNVPPVAAPAVTTSVSSVPPVVTQSSLGATLGGPLPAVPSVYPVYNNVSMLPYHVPQQAPMANTVTTSAIYGYNGVAGRHPIAPIVVPETPILSEEQFNTLKRELMREELNRRRRRRHVRSNSRSRSRSRSSISRSRTSPHRRARSPRRKIHDTDRKHVCSPYESRHPRSSRRSSSPRPTSRRDKEIKRRRQSSSPRSASASEHHERRYREKDHPRRHKPTRDYPSDAVSSGSGKRADHYQWDKRYTEENDYRDPVPGTTDSMKYAAKHTKAVSHTSSPTSYTSMPFDEPQPSNKRLCLEDHGSQSRSMKHSHSQGSLPSYYDKKMAQLSSDKNMGNHADMRHSKKDLKNLKRKKESNMGKPDKAKDRWHAETAAFLERMGISRPGEAVDRSPHISGESYHDQSPKSAEPGSPLCKPAASGRKSRDIDSYGENKRLTPQHDDREATVRHKPHTDESRDVIVRHKSHRDEPQDVTIPQKSHRNEPQDVSVRHRDEQQDVTVRHKSRDEPQDITIPHKSHRNEPQDVSVRHKLYRDEHQDVIVRHKTHRDDSQDVTIRYKSHGDEPQNVRQKAHLDEPSDTSHTSVHHKSRPKELSDTTVRHKSKSIKARDVLHPKHFDDKLEFTEDIPKLGSSKSSRALKHEKYDTDKNNSKKKTEKKITKKRVSSNESELPMEEINAEIKKKRKEKKERKEKKKDKKKKKKKRSRKEEKEEPSVERTQQVQPVLREKDDDRTSGMDYSSSDHDPSSLIPPPSKWELELDEHTNEFDEESRLEEKRNSRIPSLVSSINYQRWSVEEKMSTRPY